MRKPVFDCLSWRRLLAGLIVPVVLLCSCTLFSPTPTNEQILQAVTAFNQAQPEPLELMYGRMQVPHRAPGRAGAVLQVEDQSLQQNYTIAYDRKTKTFHVERVVTLQLGADGVYRQVPLKGTDLDRASPSH